MAEVKGFHDVPKGTDALGRERLGFKQGELWNLEASAARVVGVRDAQGLPMASKVGPLHRLLSLSGCRGKWWVALGDHYLVEAVVSHQHEVKEPFWQAAHTTNYDRRWV